MSEGDRPQSAPAVRVSPETQSTPVTSSASPAPATHAAHPMHTLDVIDAWTPETRFAVYYAPSRDTAWWETGCRWLGRDPESAETFEVPEIVALRARGVDLRALSVAPSRYGWHGTLVAPARCAAGVTPASVLAHAQAWARDQRAFELDVEAAALGRFVAIRPSTADAAASIGALAANALEAFAPLRQMPTQAEMQRRLDADLSPRQRELLARWGYPYVLDEFRFHMTLSDSLRDDAEREALLGWWRERLPSLGPLVIDSAALYVEPQPGAPFALWARLPFGDHA